MDNQISLHEASKMASCSPSTIRRWAQKGSIEANKTLGKWLVDRQSLMTHLALHSHKTSALIGASVEAPMISSEHLELRLKDSMEALRREQKINDELREEVRKLQSELIKITHEIKAVLEDKSNNLLSRWFRS